MVAKGDLMLGRFERLVQFFTPTRREEPSIRGKDLAKNAERRLLAKHEQFIDLLNKLAGCGKSEIVVADLMTQQHMSVIHQSASRRSVREMMQTGVRGICWFKTTLGACLESLMTGTCSDAVAVQPGA